MKTDHVLTPDDVHALSTRAVNQLIANAEVWRLLENKELAETIAGCLRSSAMQQLQTLRGLLDQQELEGVAPWDRDERAKKGGK